MQLKSKTSVLVCSSVILGIGILSSFGEEVLLRIDPHSWGTNGEGIQFDVFAPGTFPPAKSVIAIGNSDRRPHPWKRIALKRSVFDSNSFKVYTNSEVDAKLTKLGKDVNESVKTAQTTLTTKIDTDITSVKRELKSNLKTAQDQTSKRLNAILTAIDEELPQRLLNEEVRPLIKDMIAKEVKVQVQEELDMLRSELNKLREKVESLKK